jgi:hypothetical protein
MKKLALIILIVLNSLNTLTQKWLKTLGYPNRDDYAWDMIETYDKGYFIAAGYNSNRGWNIKTDINANSLWNENIIYSPIISPSFVVQDSVGNLYSCGFVVVDGLQFPFVAKFNQCSEKEWCKILYDPSYDLAGAAMDLLINENNQIIVLVYLQNQEQIDQIFLFCFNENGQFLWKYPYASKNNYPYIGNALGRNLYEFSDIYLISGYCYWPFPDDLTHLFIRPFFIGIDTEFNEKWILPYAVPDSVFGEAYSVVNLNDSVFMSVGERWLEGYNANSLIMFFTDSGIELGFNQINNEDVGQNIDFNVIREIAKFDDSLYISPCYLGINNELFYGEFVYNSSGDLIKDSIRANYFGTSLILKSIDNNFLIEVGVKESTGHEDICLYKINQNLEMVPFDTNQYTYDSLCPEPIPSGTINLGDCDLITDIGEIPSPKEYYESIKKIPVTAYPNPASSEITLAFQNTDHHKNMMLECYNIYGQQVHTEKIWKGQQQTKLDLHGWGKGLYFAVVKSDGTLAGSVRFIRQ